MKKSWIVGEGKPHCWESLCSESPSVEENAPHSYVTSFEVQFREEKSFLVSFIRELGKTA
jgi:hypothetical protein